MAISEFDPGAGARWYPNGLGIFNSQLFVIGGGNSPSGLLGQTTVPLSTASEAQSLSTGKWTSVETSDLPRVDGRCAIVASGMDMYLLGSGGQGPFAALFNLQAQTGPGWNTPAAWLQDASGNEVLGGSDDHDVDAKAFGKTGILVGCVGIPMNGVDVTYLAYYDTSDFSTGSTVWRARFSIYISTASLSALGLSVSDPGVNISLDWFSTSHTTTVNNVATGQLQYYLALFMTPKAQQTESVLYFFPFSVDASGNVQSIQTSSSASPGASFWPIPLANGKNGAVARDPGGRLNLYYLDSQSNVMHVVYLNTNSFAPSQTPVYTADTRAVSNNNIAPSVLYWMAPPTNNQATVYELLFYASDLRAQANVFGTAEILPNYATYSPILKAPANSVEYIIEGIFDGPIPFPNVNSQNHVFQDTLYEAGTVCYGSNKTSSVAHEQSFAWTVGVESSGSVTKGIGPAWDVSISGGTGWGSGDETGTTLAQPEPKTSNLNMQTKTINPLGTLVLDQAEMNVTVYKFTDAKGNLITGPGTGNNTRQAPLSFNVSVTFTGGVSRDFLPYAFTPGVLASYTPEQINARMKSLGYNGNYFADVILANAYEFQGSQKYLLCEWSDSGFHSAPSFECVQSSFTERGWTFDASEYAGLSGGVDAELFAASDSVMAGVTVSMEGSETDTSGSGWGVSLEEGWQGPPPCPTSNGSAISSYTFLIFFLPPPNGASLPANYWAEELITYGPKVKGQPFNMSTIDKNSAPWRITFVVTNYVSNDGKTNYAYNNKLGSL